MNICDLCQLSSPSGCTKLDNEVCLKRALKLIKASATNGDMIKTIYHPYAIKEHAFHVNVYMTEEEYCSGNETQFTTDWWNSPYKGGRE